jgi:ubiquinone/menaquinone biosynthesis C-methylase UbiE
MPLDHEHIGFEKRLLSPNRKKTEDPKEFLPELLKKTDVAAEFGSGPGYYTKIIVHYVSKIYCIDKNDGFLEIARRMVKSKKVSFLNEDSTKTSIPSKSVDVIILANAFHDMDRIPTAEEITRIIKTRGRIIVVDWNKIDSDFGPPFELRMSEEDYLRFFKGFDIYRRFAVGPMHYGMVLAKNGQT